MKRIIDGVTYNIDTSTLIGEKKYQWQDRDGTDFDCEDSLYVTRGGAFFVYETWWTGVGGENDRTYDSIKPRTKDGAQKWLLEGDVQLFNDVFGEPPEAESEEGAKPEATIYIRVPEPLKRQLEARATDAGLSMNAWSIRCVERCVAAPKQNLAQLSEALLNAYHITLSLNANPDGFSSGTLARMAGGLVGELEDAWRLAGMGEQSLDKEYPDWHSSRADELDSWEPYQDSK